MEEREPFSLVLISPESNAAKIDGPGHSSTSEREQKSLKVGCKKMTRRTLPMLHHDTKEKL